MNKFLAEMLEQPASIEKVLAHYTAPGGMNGLEEVKRVLGKGDTRQVIFTGMGSSYFVSHAAMTLFNELKIGAFAVNASELLHYNFSLLDRKTLLVCTSQSGESFEILEILKKLPPTVCTVGITNEEESTLARKADIALFCHSGKEEMTSTKTYVSTSLVTFILGWFLADRWDDRAMKKVEQLVPKFKAALTDYSHWVDPMLDFLGEVQTLQIIARGPAFSTASQGGLMFKEALKIPATGILGGEFRHGPMEMVGEGFKAILFAGRGKTLDQSMKMAGDIARFGGRVLLITNTPEKGLPPGIMTCFVEEPDEYLFSVQGIIPVQLFIDAYAKRRGFEAGSFSRGAKVTAIE